MIIRPGVGPSDGHDCVVLGAEKAKVAYGRLEQVLILREPLGEVEWQCEGHFGECEPCHCDVELRRW